MPRQGVLSIVAAATATVLVVAAASLASGPAPRTDNRVVCLDLQTGSLVWRFDGQGYGTPTLELHDGGRLVVRETRDRTGPATVLATDTGNPVAVVAVPEPSAALHLAPDLSEAPRRSNLRRRFLNSREHKRNRELPRVIEIREVARLDDADAPVWRVHGKHIEGGSIVIGEALVAAQSFPTGPPGDQAVLRGFLPGGEKPAWTVDLNKRWPQAEAEPEDAGRRERFFRISMADVEGRLVAQAWEHVFAFEPATGKLLWHVDLGDLGLVCEKSLPFGEDRNYDQWLWHGGVPIASITDAEGVVLVGFESRLVALAGATGRHRWNLRTHAFPHLQRPIVANGKVWTWLGDAYREQTDRFGGDVK